MTNSERVKRRDSCGKYGTKSAHAQIVIIGIIVTGGPGEDGEAREAWRCAAEAGAA
jgi:hypothetical protein